MFLQNDAMELNSTGVFSVLTLSICLPLVWHNPPADGLRLRQLHHSGTAGGAASTGLVKMFDCYLPAYLLSIQRSFFGTSKVLDSRTQLHGMEIAIIMKISPTF